MKCTLSIIYLNIISTKIQHIKIQVEIVSIDEIL